MNLKQLEQLVWRQTQETFGQVMKKLLEDMDQQISDERDKKRYRYVAKRRLRLTSLFGELTIKRTYYRDQTKNEYVYLLDRYLDFEKAGQLSPMVEEAAIELAIQGPSYRKAERALETFLGYRVISHETIRQHLLELDLIPKAKKPVYHQVLFIEVDGLFVKHQEKGVRGKEVRVAKIHQGWEKNGKRIRLKEKRHFIHREKKPFWEALEDFLAETYDYDPMVHKLVINGDGASWITACRDYFRDRAFFCIDRFHVIRDIRRLFCGHPRYKNIRKALHAWDGTAVMTELNSAVGTLETESQEERLEALIQQLSQYPEALGDYRKWLETFAIRTDEMRTMGSAEATMSQLAKRMKTGRSWIEEGKQAMLTGLVAQMDHMGLQTLFGRMDSWNDVQQEKEVKPPKHYVEKVTHTVGEWARGNLQYLQGKSGIPMHRALKALKGF
jgi:hypothetical protein